MAIINLPSQPTSFIGREYEISQITALLDDPVCRLLTLIGPGGIGKTRLAMEVMRQQNSTFPVGRYFIPLQRLHSHEFIISAMVESLQCPISPNRDLFEQLLEYLYGKSLLLVTDNFEHLLEGVHFLSDILAHAPLVKILTTSRERLNLVEEWVYEVGGLSFPANESEMEIETYGAVQLFMQNARRVHHSFTLTRAYKPAISRICRLVGGMPLGIELASAWVRVLPCEVIADEIQRSLDILETTVGNITPRHRNMRAAFEPTWNRLTQVERDVFRKLSVFHGSFTLEAAEAVAGASRTILRALIDKSLLWVDSAGRYTLHELLRQYGEEQLNRSPDIRAQAVDSHRAYFMRLLGDCEKQMVFLGQQKKAVDKVGDELQNVRIAWLLTVEQGRCMEMLAGGEALWGFYCMRGWDQQGADIFRWSATHLRNSSNRESEECQRILGAVLAFQGLCSQSFSEREAQAVAQESLSILRRLPVGKEMVYVLQLLVNLSHDEAEKTQIVHECLTIARAGQHGWWIPVCLLEVSELAINRGDYSEAKALLEEVLAPAHQNNYQVSSVQAFIALSQIALLEAKFSEAQSLAQKALTAAVDTGYTAAIWWIHSAIADSALLQADYLTAQTHYGYGLAICRELNDHRGSAFELSGLGCTASCLRDFSQARRYFYEALCAAKEVNNLPAILDVLSGTSGLLANTGEPERGVQFAAYVASQPFLEKITKARNTHLLQSLRTALAPEIIVSAIQQGERLNLDETVSTLLVELNQPVRETSPAAVGHSLPDSLTERELEVLRLIAEGLSNYDIAVHLFLGVSTVKTHVNRIFSKLCVKNRTQAVARARELRVI
jgi:predicted ATPase/DNA-binding CsgD family transcriptional regulator